VLHEESSPLSIVGHGDRYLGHLKQGVSRGRLSLLRLRLPLLTAVLARWKERQSGKNQYKAKSLFHIKLFYLYNEIFPAFGI
jgi:hypothetical protein